MFEQKLCPLFQLPTLISSLSLDTVQ